MATGQLGKDIYSMGTWRLSCCVIMLVLVDYRDCRRRARRQYSAKRVFTPTFTAPDQFQMEVLDIEGKIVTGSAITQTVTGYPMTFNTGNVAGGFLWGYEVTLDDTAGLLAMAISLY
ncbi:MAG: hypothetical protein U5L01_16435 [Rheinheimera sp.]|nr:hypothetical protein [Rheinheimera sp.]